MKILLNILAKDILENDYTDLDVCPITRALARAGHPFLRDTGLFIEEGDNEIYEYSDEDYNHFKSKIHGMYATKLNKDISTRSKAAVAIPIEDFSYELEIPNY